jgi:hypothetical protein
MGLVKHEEGMGALCLYVLVKEPEGTRPSGRPRRRWEDIKIYLEQDRRA